MKKVILDVDTGIDDAMAIIYAIESKQLDILGITTVNGNVPLENVTTNTLKVLQLTGREDIKVYSGAKEPYLKEAHHVFEIHGNDGIGNALDNMTIESKTEETFAADFIIESVKANPEEITLILVGPLTNLALALKKAPEIADLIKRVVIMGGAVASPGNTTPTAEFNIYADAEAAKVVFHKGLDIVLVGLDVTRHAMIDLSHIEGLAGHRYYDFIKKSTEVYRQFYESQHGRNACALHDPLTVGYVLDETFLKTQEVYVDVETKSDLSYGQTIADFSNRLKQPANMKVCLEVDAEKFVTHFMETLKV